MHRYQSVRGVIFLCIMSFFTFVKFFTFGFFVPFVCYGVNPGFSRCKEIDEDVEEKGLFLKQSCSRVDVSLSF